MDLTSVTEELKKYLKITIKSKKRLEHIYNVVNFSKKLAQIHKLPERKVEVASLGHDLFRDVDPGRLIKLAEFYKISLDKFDKNRPILLHGKVSAEFLARKFLIDDDIYQAIYYHTSGYEKMGDIGKALVISDSAGDDRNFEGVEELRKVSIISLNEGYKLAIKNKISYALAKERYILEDTYKTWNALCQI